MKTAALALLTVLVLPFLAPRCALGGEEKPAYRSVVCKFADTLLEKGRDVHGPRKTALWASVIDLEDYSVPASGKSVPATRGVRAQDRAVGGCNMHCDAMTLYTLRVLAKLTGQARYEQAVRDYLRDFLAVAQSPQTGLLAWGEHLYYDLFQDRVAEERKSHELIEWTPPWDLLWEVDPKATARAIEGLQYHFCAADPASQGWIFNRHAAWGKPGHPGKSGSQPWIKHSGLYAYSYAFLYAKTGDKTWRDRALGIGELYWNHRNPETNLTEGCLGDRRAISRHAGMGGTSLLSYWLLKASQLDPTNTAARDHALTMLKAFDHYGWDPATKTYRETLQTDGKPVDKALNPWTFAYGTRGSSLLRFGRVAAYAARTVKDPACREMAVRSGTVMRAVPVPEKFTPEEIGFAIHLQLDVFDLTDDPSSLAEADRLARLAIDKLWAGGLFRRLPGDRFYESKLGPGDLASALLRLSLRQEGKADPAGVYDWSF